MSSGNGFPGGGTDFYAGNGMGNRSNTRMPSYRSQVSGIFMDPSSQIGNRTTSLIGKRMMSEFQTNQHQNHALGGLFLRSVKPRMMHSHTSPISPLSHMEFSGGIMGQEISPLSSNLLQQQQQQRYGVALQQLRSQAVQNQVTAQESEEKMRNRLQELEKQLLDDEDEEGDVVSVITNTNSEWSEAIQNLISPSPTSSSSSSSSSSVVSPATICSKQSVMEAASAISEAKTELATEIITRLGQFANAKGNSEQRLMDYMLLALKSKINPVENTLPVTEIYGKEHAVSTQMLYDLSPCFKLGFLAANLAIIEATLGNDQTSNIEKIHVIDFDIGQGYQYMNLLHALSSRQNGKPTTVKITTVADPTNADEEKLNSVGELLSQLADRVGITLKFNVVNQKLVELTRDSLGCEPDEPLAVNFAFKLNQMPDESVSTENPRDELLRRVKALSPRVVTLIEQEINTNTAPFMARVNETWSYYGALLDSIDSTVTRENADRVKVEEGLSRNLVNSVACEGRDRVLRCEVFGKWRARMGMAGFELKPLSQNVADAMRARVNSGNRVNPGFTVKKENGGVSFGWMGRTLTVASAWR